MRLIVAEKPSMAADIAAAIGAHTRQDGYFEGGGNIVTALRGHLIELSPPDAYNPDLKNWRREHLPFMPEVFKFQVNSKSRGRLEEIKELFARPDVIEVVNACDAGREGELIFDLVYQTVRSTLPVKRLWVRSLTAKAIRDAFAILRPAVEYRGLRDSAHARQRADWLIGLNATRAQTILAREQNGDGVYSLGRVQTPTLAILVDRDLSIENFTPSDFFKVRATFTTAAGGTYSGWWFSVNSDRSVTNRFVEAQAAAVVTSRIASRGVASLVSIKPVVEKPPHLFDLTQLQRAANRKHGFTAARTLEIAQTLYEKKALTYPRTSSQYLSSDLQTQIRQHVEPLATTSYGEYVAVALARGCRLTAHHVDDTKVTDHHAIIPTTQRADFANMTEDESAIFDLVARRFLAAFYPDAQDERTQIISTDGQDNFITRGTRQVEPGWREVEPPSNKAKGDEDDATDPDADESTLLPEVIQGTQLVITGVEAVKKQTRAPSRFTESMLLAAMETAGKIIENAEMREAMKESGLGTPATRAAIIEKLIERQFVTREKKKYLRSTPLGRELISRLRSSGGAAAILASAELTGVQEAKLARIERGELSAEAFLGEIKALTREIVTSILAQAANNALLRPQDAIACPKCKKEGRDGFLRVRKPKGAEFLACTTDRAICGFISDVPPNKKVADALTSKSCPTCSGAMRVKLARESKSPFLSCVKFPDCKGVVWFGKKKKPAKAPAAETPQAA